MSYLAQALAAHKDGANTFLSTGSTRNGPTVLGKYRCPDHVVQNFEACMKDCPTFYIEELQDHLHAQYSKLKRTSEAKVCQSIDFDLRLTSKILMKAAREPAPPEIQKYYDKLRTILSYLEQHFFLDKESKDGWEAFRKYDYSKHGTKEVVRVPFSRGNRVSVFASLN